MRAIHWFRSDIRVEDNTALAAACARGSELVSVFVLDDALIRRRREAHPRLRFLHACLLDLAGTLDAAGSCLVVMRGAPERRLPELARAGGAALVTWNRDYGPYAKRRDRAARLALERDGVEVREYLDRVVFEGDEIRTAKGAPYSVFTPYRRAGGRGPLNPSRLARLNPPRRASGRAQSRSRSPRARLAGVRSRRGRRRRPPPPRSRSPAPRPPP